MKKTLFIVSILFLFLGFLQLFFVNTVEARSYPLKEITKGNIHELPFITNADYASKRGNGDYRSIYSVLWTASYYDGRDMGMGTHEGIDLAADLGTPVYASYDGEIIFAGYQSNWGNVVVIKHVWSNEVYYTNYAHLNAIYVTKGQKIKEGDIIGEVGDTGNATGPHLHFQIDKDNISFHPYYPTGCGGSIAETVNTTSCYSQVVEHTIDPIYFLEEITQREEKQNSTQNVFIESDNFVFSGFMGGFMTLDDIKRLEIGKKTEGVFLTSDITISTYNTKITSNPHTIKALGDKRQILFQTNNQTGLSIVTIQYGKQTLLEFPVLINTKEGIEKWKNLPGLCDLLKNEFGISCN